jgi:uncharacterized protein YqhQ
VSRSLIEQSVKLTVFVAYVWLVSFMQDIKRTFMYHGAEHKTIFCFEKGLPLTVENVRVQKRFHPRCGTSFIFVTLLLSILVSSVVAVSFPELTKIRALWILVKVLITPLIMGVGFEFIQLAGKYPNKFTNLLSAPGLLMQRITTAEPDDAIIEVAIEAMKAALSGKVEDKTENNESEKSENAE